MNRRDTLQQILSSQIDNFATTLQPNTIANYRQTLRHFLRYLQTFHPQVDKPSQLRRDPHILGFLRILHQRQPPLKNGSRCMYLLKLRRLLNELAERCNCPALQGLVVRDDLPPKDLYLPKPLSLEDDNLLDRYLRTQNDLVANALLLLRATGIRIGECRNLTTDCLYTVGPDQWTLKIPLGKLHTERWLPLDNDTRAIITRLLALRPISQPAKNAGLLLLTAKGCRLRYDTMRRTLAHAALQAGCGTHVTPHRLRHSYATEMIRAGVSLPAVMHLLGHKSIRMTLCYVQVTPNDLHQQYHQARRNIASKYLLAKLPVVRTVQNTGNSGMVALRNSLAAAQHLLAHFRLQLSDPAARNKLARLANRLVKISTELANF
jgi:site-specific recombinase XerD